MITNKTFIVCPNGRLLLFASRTATHTFCEAICATLGHSTDYDVHPAENCERAVYSENIEIAALIRNPIERFLSLCAKENHSVLYGITNEFPVQIFDNDETVPNNVTLFKFETQMQECANWLGITASLNWLDPYPNKPVLIESELATLEMIYKKDLEIWNSI